MQERPNDEIDTSPLLDREEQPELDEIEDETPQIKQLPQGTILSSCTNLINTILGSGMLAMPSAIAATGLGFGVFLILFCACCSGFGLFLLSRMAAQVGRKSSFFTCATITYPNAAVYFDLAIAVKCFGVSISYLVILGGLMPQVMLGFYPDMDLDSIWRNREFWITVSIITVIPTAFMRRLDSLRYTSAFSLLAVVYLLYVVISFYIFPVEYMPEFPTIDDIEWIRFDASTLSHLPIFVFSFTCHQNIFAIHNELTDNSAAQLNKVISRSIGTSFLVYQTIGIIGYLTFGALVSSNIISQYPPSLLITVGQLLIGFLVLFSYPLQCHPCRNSCDKVFPGSDTNGMSNTRFNMITTGIMISSYLIAISIKDLSTVLSIVGATGSTTICYILPGLFYFKLCQNQRVVGQPMGILQVASGALVVLGIVVMFTSLFNIFFLGGGGH
ncbi:hypothetical protein HDV01_001197 [Terramyces sp. JEL0728]|nr:hypothetical protein HDV01_001197 [Terramyces sp. JEL0728]